MDDLPVASCSKCSERIEIPKRIDPSQVRAGDEPDDEVTYTIVGGAIVHALQRVPGLRVSGQRHGLG